MVEFFNFYDDCDNGSDSYYNPPTKEELEREERINEYRKYYSSLSPERKKQEDEEEAEWLAAQWITM